MNGVSSLTLEAFASMFCDAPVFGFTGEAKVLPLFDTPGDFACGGGASH